MNSETSNPKPPLPSTQPSVPATPPSTFSPESSPVVTSETLLSVDFKEAPLETLLEMQERELVHNLTPEQLAAFIQRCAVLRSSAQSRKAALTKEAGVEKKTKSPTKKDSVSLALDLLKQMGI